MREILFRGKRLDNGEWIQGDLLQNVDCLKIREQEKDIKHIARSFVVHTETIGQYTGLTDKNGTKIFEGDIVRDEYGYIGVVEFGKGTFDSGVYSYYGWYRRDKDGYIDHNELYVYGEYDFFEIIGNIHDNQELMEGGGSDAR